MIENKDKTIEENGSGLGKDSLVPPKVLGKFNWGAFFLCWVWGIGNKVWIALISLVLSLIPIIGLIVLLPFAIWLGIKGNELAWKSKKWENIEHFHKVQKKWAIVSIILATISIYTATITTIPNLTKETAAIEYKTATKKSISILNQAAQLNAVIEVPIPKYFSNGQELAKYFSASMAGKVDANRIITDYDMDFQFEANGDCSNKSCKVIVDLNGIKKGPNKNWEIGGSPSDIIILDLTKNKLGFEIVFPKQLDNMH